MDPKTFARGALLATLVAGAAACAAIPRAPKERDAEAKAFAPTPGKANLYVFRDAEVGKLLSATVLLDGKLLGATQGHTFLLAQVDPGPHTLLSQAENDVELRFTAEEGRNVFVWQEVTMAVLKVRAQLHLVDETRGREGVASCQLVLPVRLE